MPTEEQFYFQLASGLEYLHFQKDLVHDSIKPSNILISSNKNPQIKLSDFGLKRYRLNQSSVQSPSVDSVNNCWLQDSRCWLACEYFKHPSSKKRPRDKNQWENRIIKSRDIYAAGNIFFYFSSGGFHLFGDNFDQISRNTVSGHQINLFCK